MSMEVEATTEEEEKEKEKTTKLKGQDHTLQPYRHSCST
jgi:hypothetical protein